MGGAGLGDEALIKSNSVHREWRKRRRFKIRDEIHEALGGNRVGAFKMGYGDVGQKLAGLGGD